MGIKITELKDWKIIEIKGNLVSRKIPGLNKQLEKVKNDENYNIAFDMSEIPYIDSSAITWLINLRSVVTKTGRKLAVFGANSEVKSVFSIVGMEELIDIYPFKEDLLEIIDGE